MLTAARLSSRPRLLAAEEDPDQLFLLPECVFEMDRTQLRRDLAGLDFAIGRGHVWLSKCNILFNC